MQYRFAAALALAATLALGTAQAQTAPKVTHLAQPGVSYMFVGNSFFYYNNGMPGYVQRLIAGLPAADQRPYNSTMVTIGGSGFDWHDMESLFRPNAVGYYTFTATNDIVFNTRNKYWDAVVMMDCSQCPIHPQLSKVFTGYARTNSETVRKHGAEPVLFMSWAYSDKPEMTTQLAEAYTVAGNANNALVVPAGLAFARVVKERPDIVLYQPDKRHPTLEGTYLGASTLYAALFQRSAGPSTYTAGLPPDIAQYLRDAAWRTVQSYYGATPTQ